MTPEFRAAADYLADTAMAVATQPEGDLFDLRGQLRVAVLAYREIARQDDARTDVALPATITIEGWDGGEAES